MTTRHFHGQVDCVLASPDWMSTNGVRVHLSRVWEVHPARSRADAVD